MPRPRGLKVRTRPFQGRNAWVQVPPGSSPSRNVEFLEMKHFEKTRFLGGFRDRLFKLKKSDVKLLEHQDEWSISVRLRLSQDRNFVPSPESNPRLYTSWNERSTYFNKHRVCGKYLLVVIFG